MYGPALPEELKEKSKEKGEKRKRDGAAVLGPSLPPELKKLKENAEVIGPALPPTIGPAMPQEKSATIGPALPPGKSPIGPALPPGMSRPSGDSANEDSSDDDGDDVIGPLPPGTEQEMSTAQMVHSMRRMKNKEKEAGDGAPQRESWMTDIPERLGGDLGMPVAKSRLGDGCRTTSDKAGWMETPQDKERRLQGFVPDTDPDQKRKQFASSITAARDKEMAAAVAEYNKKTKRDESLLEKHQKKKKKEKKKKHKKDKKHGDSSPPAARRPFDREKDLKTNVLDDAQKKAFIKRTQKLTSRFGHGSQQFL